MNEIKQHDIYLLLSVTQSVNHAVRKHIPYDDDINNTDWDSDMLIHTISRSSGGEDLMQSSKSQSGTFWPSQQLLRGHYLNVSEALFFQLITTPH